MKLPASRKYLYTGIQCLQCMVDLKIGNVDSISLKQEVFKWEK